MCGVALLISRVRREAKLVAAVKKCLYLHDRAQPGLVHVDHHPEDDQPNPAKPKTIPPGSFLPENTSPAQAHTSLDKADVMPIAQRV